MSELTAQRVTTLRYRDLFVFGLLAVSVVPLAIAVLNFEITNATVYAITAFWSVLLVLNGAHVWITLVYYCDQRWLAQFKKRPMVFFVAPLAIIAGCTVLMAWHNIWVGLTLIYSAVVINVWHHAKQNWGVLSLIARTRRTDVSFMRIPLVYAWPFFIVSIALYMPEVSYFAGADILRSSAYFLAAAYIGWCIVVLWNNAAYAQGDPLIFALCAALMLYFIPLVAMFGKPYALLVTFGAHSLQYYFLVLVSLSLRGRLSVGIRSVALPFAVAMVTVTLATYAAYEATKIYGPPALWESVWVRLIVGVATGVNLVHFWLDAFIWRFTDKEMRTLHGEGFAF